VTEIASPGTGDKRTGDKRTVTVRTIARWLLIAGYLLAVICFTWNPTPIAQALAAIGIAAACLHASMTYGFRHMLALFAICVVTTFAIENLGVATGFPFGHYHFEVGANLPHVGAIPVIVGPLWFGMGYFSWRLACILLDGADRRLDRNFNLIALPIVAAFVATQWDMVMEPSAATIGKAWIWHDGGAIFGVPLSNYFGWLLTAWLFFQMFALYLRGQRGAWVQEKQLALNATAILFYLSGGLTHIVPWMTGQSGDVSDAAGLVWKIAELREATVATMTCTMLFTALLAALRLAKSTQDG